MTMHRRHRRRGALLAAGLASVLLIPFAPVAAAATPATGVPAYEMILLPVPEGSMSSQVNGADGVIIHADGQVVPVLAGAWVTAMTDTGIGAGMTAFGGGQAAIWVRR